MAKSLTCWQLTNQIRKILGASHPKSPFILSYLEAKGWVEQKEPYKYSLSKGVLVTPLDARSIAEELSGRRKRRV